MSNLFKVSLLHAFDVANRFRHDPVNGRPLIESMGDQLILPLSNPPPVQCNALVVFGAGEVSGSVALRAAEMAIGSVLAPGGTVIFSGGIEPLKKDKANGQGLIPRLTKAGVAPPQPGEAEGPYMERIFVQRLKEAGIDPDSFTRKIDAKSTNTQENARRSGSLGGYHAGTIGIVALPYHTMRAIGTWRKEVGSMQTIRPLHAWPKELGITEDNWKDSALARVFVADEGQKFLLPNPQQAMYVKRGFAHPISVEAEMHKAYLALDAQNAPAAAKWLKESPYTWGQTQEAPKYF